MASTPNPRTELYIDAHRNPVQDFFGHKEGTGTDATNECLFGTLTGTTPKHISGLVPGGLYEFMAMDEADLLDGAPDHLWYRPGGSASALPDPGTSMPWRCFTDDKPLRVRLLANQTTISFVAANTAKTIRIYGRLCE
jgi:hypothetical protein